MSFAFLRRGLPALAIAAAVALPVAGCGAGASSSAGGDPGLDPAQSVPASAPLYLEARVHPEGSQQAALDSVSRRLLGGQDARTAIVAQIDKALGKQGLTYARDLEPWLGDRVGVAVTRLGSGKDADALAVLASRDDDRAQAFVDGLASTERAYRGASYRVKDAKHAAAVHEHAVLIGTEAGVKSAIDAGDGRSLAESGAFKEARDEVDDDDLGWLYVDPSRALDGALSLAPAPQEGTGGALGAGPQVALLKGLLGGSGIRSIAAGLRVADDALNVHAAIIGLKHEPGAGDAAAAVAAAPAGSWLSLGIGDVGGTLKRALGQLGGGASGGADPQVLLGALGLDLERDLLPWMGSATLFVRGTTKDDLAGALVVQSKDPAASRRAIGLLRTALTRVGLKPTASPSAPAGAEALHLELGSLPGGLDVVAQGDRFVLAFGPDALRDALAAGARLGDDAAFRSASGLLRDAKPMLYLDLPRVLGLLSSGSTKLPAAAQALGPAVAGIDGDGDVTRVEVAVGLR